MGATTQPCSSPTASLWVRLDLTPEDAANEPGSLRLQGAAGGYDKTIPVAGNFVANPAPDDTVDVHFDSVPTTDNYSLTYIAGDGSETMIVQNAAFSSLQDDSLPPENGGTPPPSPEPQS